MIEGFISEERITSKWVDNQSNPDTLHKWKTYPKIALKLGVRLSRGGATW